MRYIKSYPIHEASTFNPLEVEDIFLQQIDYGLVRSVDVNFMNSIVRKGDPIRIIVELYLNPNNVELSFLNENMVRLNSYMDSCGYTHLKVICYKKSPYSHSPELIINTKYPRWDHIKADGIKIYFSQSSTN